MLPSGNGYPPEDSTFSEGPRIFQRMVGQKGPVRRALQVLSERGLPAVVGRVRLLVFSDNRRIGLRRDLRIPLKPPDALVPLQLRRLEAPDVDALLRDDPTDSAAERELRAERRHAARELPSHGYVAVSDGALCYVQWLLPADANDAIQRCWPGLFPILRPGEALLEAAYTPPAFRGKGVMSAAMARLADQAAEMGAMAALTFVAPDNIPSLRGCARAGFEPYTMRHIAWRFFRRRTTYRAINGEPVPEA